MKPGIKTTEFWLSLAILVAGLVLLGRDSETYQAIGGVLVAASGMGYSISRGLAKKPPIE